MYDFFFNKIYFLFNFLYKLKICINYYYSINTYIYFIFLYLYLYSLLYIIIFNQQYHIIINLSQYPVFSSLWISCATKRPHSSRSRTTKSTRNLRLKIKTSNKRIKNWRNKFSSWKCNKLLLWKKKRRLTKRFRIWLKKMKI